MNLFTRPCKLCSTGTTPLFGATKIKLQTAEGTSTLRICNECATTLESIRHLKSGRELREDDLDERPL